MFNITRIKKTEYRISDGNVLTVGNPILFSRSGVDASAKNIFLLNEVISVPGALFAFSVYFRNNRDVIIQIWRPVTSGGTRYELISQLRVTPAAVEHREDVSIVVM